MGCAGSAQVGSPDEVKKSKFIDQELRKDKKKNSIKLLLLGAGESGKSTIAKQFSMINNCFTAQDFQQHKMIVHANAIDFAKILLRQLDKEGKQLESNLTPQKERILALQTFSTTFTPEIAADIKAILTSPLIQDALARRKDFGLPECSSYIFNKLDDVAKTDYLPSVEDCLHCRQRTSGVIETSLKYKDSDFTMVDVGGQRTERRKWIRCFEEVTVMLFVVALDEYDMTLMEDSEVNRMEESMAVLSDLSESAPLSKTPFIIFLNKKDLFEKKISKKDLTCLFPEYTGGCDYNGAIQFLREVYTTQAKNGNKDRALFIHETCAIDRQNIELVWQAMVQIITDQALKRANLAA